MHNLDKQKTAQIRKTLCVMCPDIRLDITFRQNNNIQTDIRFDRTASASFRQFRWTHVLTHQTPVISLTKGQFRTKGFYFFLRTLLRRGYHSPHFGYRFILHVCNTTARSLFFIGERLLSTVLQTSKIPSHFQQWCGFATFCALASPHKARHWRATRCFIKYEASHEYHM